MKRDMKLCGQILAEVEKLPTMELAPVGVEGRNAEEIDFHVMLLKEAGFVDAELSALWPQDAQWRIEEHARGLFSHAFVARMS